MGRGLSDLQKSILLQAYKKLEQIGRYNDQSITGMLLPSEVLAEFYGWETQIEDSGHEEIYIGSQLFSKEEIGSNRYNSARAAVSKAFQRLEARGLVERVHTTQGSHVAIKLLHDGIEAAKRLLANTVT